MRITRNLHTDQENLKRFVTALGGAAVELGHSKRAKPAFFILANDFIHEYVEGGFFKKEELLIKVLEDNGFSPNEGPILAMRTDQKKSRDAAKLLINALKQWQTGDENARTEVSWAASQYTSALRQHLDRLKNLIFPLLEQTISEDEQHKVSESLTNIVFEGSMKNDTEKYIKIIGSLEEELSDWK